MAIDDFTTVIAINLGSGSAVDRQPSAGVNEMLLDGGLEPSAWEGTTPNAAPGVNIARIDGTNNQGVLELTDAGKGVAIYMKAKHVSSNAQYFRLTNAQASASDYAFAVLEVG